MKLRNLKRSEETETRRKRKVYERAAKIFVCLAVCAAAAFSQDIALKNTSQTGDFPLVDRNVAAEIYVSNADHKVVKIAADDFASDVEKVSNRRPTVKFDAGNLSANIVVIGTLNKNPLIEKLIESGKLDVSKIAGKRESFQIEAVKHPFPNVKSALIIAGSDRRGTAFGVYEMSQKIGVSPWVWWADVAPAKRAQLIVSANAKLVSSEPSVKYRGIFLNDEDWGLQPWAARTFEPETGDIGPKTYAKIFELLLRLKANTCWAAMHEVTKPFNEIAGNAQTADDYAIVMGSSHAEPMLRNNVGEWKDDKARYNFVVNEKGVTDYWEARLTTNGAYENIYTLGMRGIHDSPIQGTKSQAERIPVLEKIIRTQRALLRRHVGENVATIPQIFCPYKEVLADYRAGLAVPEDVTIVFPDDNFGYIRYFPNHAERKRSGGFGVYYHISYLGRPLSYLWLNTAPPALIWEEMSKAYDHEMREFWMLNVGDIKPAEIGIELFMQMAYDAKKWRRENLSNFLEDWARREFGADNSQEIARVMDEYYRLGFERKPEHLQWYLPKETPRPSDYSAINYGDEIQRRLDAYANLRKRAETVYARLRPAKKDAFYELVLYPTRAAHSANERFFAYEKAALYFKQNRASAKIWAQKSIAADAEIKTETKYFNETLANGKWRGMMSPEMGENQWTSMRSTAPKIADEILNRTPPEKALLGVAVEGRENAVAENEIAALPAINHLTDERRFIDVFNRGAAPADWTATAKQPWLRLSLTKGNLNRDARITVSVDWRKIPRGARISGEIEIVAANEARRVAVPVFNPPLPKDAPEFVESNGVISIEAEHYTNKTARRGASWEIVPGLGRTGDSVAVYPTTMASVTENFNAQSPRLEYRFYAFSAGEFGAACFLIPTQPLAGGRGLRYAVAIDDQAPKIVAAGAETEVSAPQWAQNVLNAAAIGAIKLKFAAGAHVLKIYAVDAGVILDKIVINTGGAQKSYLGAPETRRADF